MSRSRGDSLESDSPNSGSSRRASGIRAVFAIRDMRLLLLGFTTSRTGDFLYSVALVVFIAESTGSAAWVGAAAFVRLLPLALLGPIAGVLGDRLPPRLLLVTCDLAQAAVMLIMAVLVAFDSPPIFVLILAGISGALSSPYAPVLTAVTPRLVAEEQLAATNTFISTVEFLALIVGPAVGGLLLLLGGPEVPIALNALTFLTSAALVGALRLGRAPAMDDAKDATVPTGFVTELVEGLRATVSDRVVAILVVFTSGATFIYGFELVYLVFVADDLLDLGAGGIGYLNAAIGVGGALGALITNRLANSPHVRLVMGATLVGCGVPLGLLAVITEPWMAYVVLAIEGLAAIALDVVVTTALQRVVPQAVLARVSAVLGSLTVLAILLGNLVAVALLSVASLRVSLLISGAILPVLAIGLLPALRDLEDRARRGREELKPAVAALRASGLLEGAALPVVERLATSAVAEHVPAGAILLRQGDEATDVFVLAEGRLKISVDGVDVNVVEAPGYVGEIGLLLGSRRTATVTAATDALLHRISGRDFSAAVGGSAPIALQTEMAVRLRRTGTS